MSRPAIEIDHLAKRYRIGLAEELHDTFGGAVLSWLGSPLSNLRRLRRLSRFDPGDDADVIWALRDVTFAVAAGEVVGIIGANGAGKSTLLKILSGITEPTAGRAVIHGRVASLLEVGTGFHPDLTGRDNVYLNGTILGMSKGEIDRKFDEIVDFAEVGTFIDTPIKRYSSGMHVRLAFSVAAHLEPEILLIDEVLAVGDAAFRKRCLGKMGEVAASGRTVLFVSHNLSAVERLCERSVVLDHGRIVFAGPTAAAIDHYLRHTLDDGAALGDPQRRPGRGRVRFTRIWAESGGAETVHLTSGGEASICLAYRISGAQPIRKVRVRLGWTNLLGDPLLTCINDLSGFPIPQLPGPEGTIRIHLPRLPLNAGTYRLNAWLKSEREIEDLVAEAGELTVAGGDFYGTGMSIPADCGPLLADHSFEVLAPSTAAGPAGR
ncbi:MAG: ABC transporter ATP-binding protein [Acidobacteria bacterium]|nr:MAG: ABC transporter ATP-binding protein [Acidobacteriota bacterium]